MSSHADAFWPELWWTTKDAKTKTICNNKHYQRKVYISISKGVYMNICVPSNKYSRCACTVLISVVSACELFIEKTAENMRSVYRCLRSPFHQKIPTKHAYKIHIYICNIQRGLFETLGSKVTLVLQWFQVYAPKNIHCSSKVWGL